MSQPDPQPLRPRVPERAQPVALAPFEPIASAVLRAFAALLDYPSEGFVDSVARSVAVIARTEPALAEGAEPLGAWSRTVTLEEAEELFARSFDLNPACTLDLGWHVYGESYKRGALLVGLREGLRRHGIDEGTELPDHMPQVLRLLAAMQEQPAEDDEPGDAELLRKHVIGPALRAIAMTFHGSMHPYAPLLRAAALRLAPDVRTAMHLPMYRGSAEGVEGNHA